MPTVSSDAIVLMRLDYSETSQIVVFFTREHGKVRAIAKGVKRGTKNRFAVGIDLLDVGVLVVSHRPESTGLANVTEWKQTRNLSGLRERLNRLQAAEYAAEITAHLTEDWDPHPEVFEALAAVLTELSGAEEPFPASVAFQVQLLRAVGLLPRFEACVACERVQDLIHFSSHQGGMVCRHCESGVIEKRQVSQRTLEILQQLTGGPARGTRAGEFSAATTSIGPRGETIHKPSASSPPTNRNAGSALVGPFALLNYHISHLIGREPRLAAALVPKPRRRLVE